MWCKPHKWKNIVQLPIQFFNSEKDSKQDRKKNFSSSRHHMTEHLESTRLVFFLVLEEPKQRKKKEMVLQ